MSLLGIILLVFLFLLLIGGLPHWGYTRDRGYGYAPSSVLGLLLVIVIILALTGRI